MNLISRHGKSFWLFVLIATICWLLIFPLLNNPFQIISEYWHFFILGIGGAVAANSTGAGGGIVFIPAFTSLGVSNVEALGTSIAIQCFGMTAGSISWLRSIHRKEHGGEQSIKLTHNLIVLSGLSAIAGMLLGQYVFQQPPFSTTTIFRYFSIFFGFMLLYISLKKNPYKHTRYHIRRAEMPLIILTCIAGGAVTSWISVGAGEWLAILLFFLGYPTMIVVCTAVCISSMTVLAGVSYHLFIANSVSWEILLFAAPAAIVGGSVARLFAEKLGPIRLKMFFATWILATGFAMS